jgi:hypothetical protein
MLSSDREQDVTSRVVKEKVKIEFVIDLTGWFIIVGGSWKQVGQGSTEKDKAKGGAGASY